MLQRGLFGYPATGKRPEVNHDRKCGDCREFSRLDLFKDQGRCDVTGEYTCETRYCIGRDDYVQLEKKDDE